MDHVAIMKKSWHLLEKILSGEKKIESRWYLKKSAPWNKIKANDIIYFKNSGEAIKIRAEVSSVLQFNNLTPKKVKDILNEYGVDDGIKKEEIENFYHLFKNKKYCILIFLKNAQEFTSFKINKAGFGAMSAWVTMDDIERIKI